jgi:hypothetical protein
MKQICDFKIADYIRKIYNHKDDLGENKAFMLIAHLASFNSLDPHSKTGACIVSNDGELVSIGWNAMPFEETRKILSILMLFMLREWLYTMLL